MRRALLFATAACSFEPGSAITTDARLDADEADAATIDADVDAPPAAFCDPTSSALVACYQLDGNTFDASGHNLNATMTNVTFVAGKVGMAMQFGATSAADVLDSPLFDVAAFTIEAWINPSQLPGTGLRAGILDCNGQYGLFLREMGTLQCLTIGGASVQASAVIATNAWTHVACTYNGTTATLYVNGVSIAVVGGGGTLSAGGTSGISVAADNPPGSGSRLIGRIDQVRIFNVAHSASEICSDAQCSQ